MALDPKILDDLARRLTDVLPPGVRAVRDDLERNFRAVLQSTLARLDLVTRDEFDVQVALLTRTRERLDKLETQISKLEENARTTPSSQSKDT
jgi:BMFP domain-containing protein YqiC